MTWEWNMSKVSREEEYFYYLIQFLSISGVSQIDPYQNLFANPATPHQQVDYVGLPQFRVDGGDAPSRLRLKQLADVEQLQRRRWSSPPCQLTDFTLSHFPPLPMPCSPHSPQLHRKMIIISRNKSRNSFRALCLDSKPIAETQPCSRSLLSCLVYIVRPLQLHWHLASVRIFHPRLISFSPNPNLPDFFIHFGNSQLDRRIGWKGKRGRLPSFSWHLLTPLVKACALPISYSVNLSLHLSLCIYAILLLFALFWLVGLELIAASGSNDPNKDLDEVQRLLKSAARDCVPQERNSFVAFQATTGVEVSFYFVLKIA